MATIKMTNPSDEKTVYIDNDAGDRENRYAIAVFSPSETKSIDEADIPSTSSFADALKSGDLELDAETDIDSLSSVSVKNFLAGGLYQKYFYAGEALAENRIVHLDTTEGKIMYPSAIGELPVGVTAQDATLGEYIRVQNAGTLTIESAGTIAVGDKVVGDSTGRGLASTTVGHYYIGECTVGGGTGENINVTMSYPVIAIS